MAKVIASPGVIGVMAGALGFMFYWPKDVREGVSRIIASGICSHFFGDAVLWTIVRFADWIPLDEIRAGAYLMAGLPGWFVLGCVFHYFKRNEGKDIQEITHDVSEILRDK